MTLADSDFARDPDQERISFGSKAETLERLRGKLDRARVLPQHSFVVDAWTRDRTLVLDAIRRRKWADDTLIVRSSCAAEDAAEQSLAGQYVSVPDVFGRQALESAIDRVVASYGPPLALDGVLVQPMLRGVERSGVAFSADPGTGGPYYVINYDDISGHTDSVTSGRAAKLKTYYHCRLSNTPAPNGLQNIVDLLDELQARSGCRRLDVEFCVADGQLYLLQVRRLTGHVPQAPPDDLLRSALRRLEGDIQRRQGSQYGVCGRRTVFGVMPDWNPAEVIGLRPRPLALSLYREVVTDSIWAYQRDNYGYRNLRSHPLMVSFHGIPYVDVRVSANSFIPKDIDDPLARRLTDFYIDRLIQSPEQHDKVEFEILFTCYTLDLPERLAALDGFDVAEKGRLAASLRELTARIIHSEDGIWRRDLAKIRRLEQKLIEVGTHEMSRVARIYWLIEDCKRYGTLPFAGLARAGFIAVQLLDSLVSIGVLSVDERAVFLSSIRTVSSGMSRDFRVLGRSEFLTRYGHLRPGCYDILSPRYDETPDRYFDWTRDCAANEAHSGEFRLSLEQFRRVQRALVEHGLNDDVLGLFDFIRGAIEGREHAKFVFSRCISESLSILEQLGAEHGLSRDDLSYVDVRVIRELYTASDAQGASLAESIRLGRERYKLTQALRLPPLIVEPRDVWGFHMLESSPNYITRGTASGPVVGPDVARKQLQDAIVMIPSADPGYDWIFTCGIAGFVTMYGGVNSHMAIRAAEFGIPAVIGAGERSFGAWREASRLHIDCQNGSVRGSGR
ncbi:MAG: PEP/pyruvate-binding domain-containing protein [Nannocystaceae bacterium]